MSQPTDSQQLSVCPRHPDRESYVRCQRCGRPACPDCQRPAAVGIQCVDCVKDQARTVRQATTVFGGRATGGNALATKVIIGLCVLVYLGELVRPGIVDDLAFGPAVGWHEPWRAVTAAFLHSREMPLHIGLNMLVLWQIGPYIESLVGRLRFVVMYLVCAIGGSVGVVLLASPPGSSDTTNQAIAQHAGWFTGVVGASGAVFGLFGALLLLNRHLGRSSTGIYLVVAVNAVFGFIYPGISWQAHLGGFLSGLACAGVMAALAGPSRRRWHLPAMGLVLVLLLVVVALKYLGVPDGYR